MIRVLVVDDDFRSRGSTAASSRGYPVTGRGRQLHGRPGLDAEGALRPDLVLLDIHLPDVDGLTLLPRLREAHPDLTPS